MNILIVLPGNQPIGGNWTYSGRLQRGLQPSRIHITRKTIDQVHEQDFQAATILHCYNAYNTGRHIVRVAKALCKPLIITMTGTDVNEYLNHPVTRLRMVEVVEYASRIIFLTEGAKKKLCAVFPGVEKKCQVINPGIDLPDRVGKRRSEYGFQEEEFIFLLVAGIRPVKRPLDAIEPLKRVYRQYPNVRFVLAGPILDKKVFQEIEQTFQGVSFAKYIGSVPYDEISELYRVVDVVLNTSSSEGLSHALLEAMSLGKPILASNVPGNRDLIQNGENGYLYCSVDEFVQRANLLITNEQVRKNVGQKALKTINTRYSLRNELDAFRTMYFEVANNTYIAKCR